MDIAFRLHPALLPFGSDCRDGAAQNQTFANEVAPNAARTMSNPRAKISPDHAIHIGAL
jgi:hypothetical protein